jgi:simple sugar transport system ATP-binding protein
MVGRDVLFRVEKPKANPKDVVLEVQDLEVLDNRLLKAVHGISLKVRSGEILGVAGVEGNGQRELVEAIVGLRPAAAGKVFVSNQEITHMSVRQRRDVGMACVPEDRYARGVALRANLEDNLIISAYNKPPIAKGQLIDLQQVTLFAQDLIRKFDVRTPSSKVMAGALSGGNMQKLVLARELNSNPDLLIVAQPTRGLDVGSIEFVHRCIIEARDNGAAVLLVSAELEEIMSLSDRIIVVYEGEVMGEVEGALANEESLGLWMAGVDDEARRQEKAFFSPDAVTQAAE